MGTKTYAVLVFVIVGLAISNTFVYLSHEALSQKLGKRDVQYQKLLDQHNELLLQFEKQSRDYRRRVNETNKVFSAIVIEYNNALRSLHDHLSAIWDDKHKKVQIYNYRIEGKLFHLQESIRLLKHAYRLVKPYAENHTFFNVLSTIMCNSSLGDTIRAFQLVYGHIYAFNIPLGVHEIDTDLLIYSSSLFQKISKILSEVRPNGLPPQDQIGEEELDDLRRSFNKLNEVVSNYLSKPGTLID